MDSWIQYIYCSRTHNRLSSHHFVKYPSIFFWYFFLERNGGHTISLYLYWQPVDIVWLPHRRRKFEFDQLLTSRGAQILVCSFKVCNKYSAKQFIFRNIDIGILSRLLKMKMKRWRSWPRKWLSMWNAICMYATKPSWYRQAFCRKTE